jgi:hypothetical protein
VISRAAPPILFVAAGLVLVSALALDQPAPMSAQRAPVRIARRTGRYTSLSGVWSGAYSYAAVFDVTPVPFNALIQENGGALTGDIDEPNTFADPTAPRLFASLTGARAGSEVAFAKKYNGAGGAAHVVRYHGVANPDLTRIEGRWTVGGARSGAFFMERSGAEAEAAVSRGESATRSP